MENQMWRKYYCVASVEEALQIITQESGQVRIVAGATDLILEIERGIRPGINTLVDITRIPGMNRITIDEDGLIHLGPLVTHNHCIASKLIVEKAFPLARAAWEVGSPQIRNRGTIAGNLITASPANDTITPLMALGAKVTLYSQRGERIVPLSDFYTGVRGTVMEPDEMLVDIAFPAMTSDQRGTFIKVGLRRAQAISVVNSAVVLTYEHGIVEGDKYRNIKDVNITLGAVAPTIIHALEAEEYLKGKELVSNTISQAAILAKNAAHPIDDIRGSLDYRKEMVRVSVTRCLRALSNNNERDGFPVNPILLDTNKGSHPQLFESELFKMNSQIVTKINNKEFIFTGGYNKSLLRLLREDAGLTGTKEGCAEGECGACTVILDGMAVMSCLVPAARAHGAEILTIEGLAHNGNLHRVQQAFVDEGAVQCGYCTPGFIMSAVKLLEENPSPTLDEIRHSITGNLCRCTGYYKIIQAIESAAKVD
jgi:carbon-monoxide dehydrogenase medium subunit